MPNKYDARSVLQLQGDLPYRLPDPMGEPAEGNGEFTNTQIRQHMDYLTVFMVAFFGSIRREAPERFVINLLDELKVIPGEIGTIQPTGQQAGYLFGDTSQSDDSVRPTISDGAVQRDNVYVIDAILAPLRNRISSLEETGGVTQDQIDTAVENGLQAVRGTIDANLDTFEELAAAKQDKISAPSEIGAATSAQGAKADSAIQSGDARLKFIDQGFADLAAAVTGAGAANADLVLTQVHTVDADLTISVPLSFRGGAISVDAGVTVTITEQIPMTEFRHIFLGAGTIVMGGTAFRTRPEWWGAQRTGLFDCALAIMSAYNAVKGIHGIVNYVPGEYGIASRLDIGDGVLGTTVSTTAGVTFESWNSGVGGGEYTLPNLITQIKWIGAANDNEFMMRINGPTHSIRMSNLTFNCNALVSGIDMAHCYNGYNHYARVENYTQWGWHIVSDGDAPTGITQGAFDNHFERCVARLPAKATATGWLVHWASRIVLDHCESVYGGAGDSAGFRIGQMDNCTWIQPFSAPAGPISGNACGMRFDVQNAIAPQQGLPPVYMGAWDNTFIMPIALGGVKAFDRFNNEVFALDHDSFYSPNIFVGFPERDGQTAPDIRGINIITHTGRMIGHWTGVLETLSGQTPDLLSTGSAEWFFPTGCGAGVATGGFDRFMIMPSPGKFLMSWAYLGGAPGSGNAREFHIEKNGTETSLVNRFADADVGSKYQLGVVNFNEGDAISFKCDIEGTPAAARAHWFARYQLTGTGVLG